MKFSCFNSIIPLSDKSSLIYNSYTDSFVIFNSDLKDVVLNDFSRLKVVNVKLYRILLDAKCYVEDELDEFECLKKMNDEYVNDPSNYFLIINPTLACNLTCWYCYENHVLNSKMSNQVQNQTKKLIEKIVIGNEELKSFGLSFFGGEPLIYFNAIVLPFIQFSSEICRANGKKFSISFTSNGTLINKRIIDELTKYSNISFQVTLDGSEDYHDNVRFLKNKKGTYRMIMKNIILLLENNISVRMRINYTRENLDSIRSVFNDIQDFSNEMKEKFEIDFHRVWQDREGNNELENIRAIVNLFVDRGFKVIFNELDGIRNSCYADKINSLVVNYNGDIYKCTAKDFSKNNREGYLDVMGDVVWENSPDYRAKLKLKNMICKNCRIAPLCAGGCSRFILERENKGDDSCRFENSEFLMDQLILDRFDSLIR